MAMGQKKNGLKKKKTETGFQEKHRYQVHKKKKKKQKGTLCGPQFYSVSENLGLFD